jgi:hypothetical protein
MDAGGDSIKMKAKIPHRRRRIAVILTLAIPALIGSIAFGTDIAVLYMNWAQLQKSMIWRWWQGQSICRRIRRGRSAQPGVTLEFAASGMRRSWQPW